MLAGVRGLNKDEEEGEWEEEEEEGEEKEEGEEGEEEESKLIFALHLLCLLGVVSLFARLTSAH